jgi:hypothetical protein
MMISPNLPVCTASLTDSTGRGPRRVLQQYLARPAAGVAVPSLASSRLALRSVTSGMSKAKSQALASARLRRTGPSGARASRRASDRRAAGSQPSRRVSACPRAGGTWPRGLFKPRPIPTTRSDPASRQMPPASERSALPRSSRVSAHREWRGGPRGSWRGGPKPAATI